MIDEAVREIFRYECRSWPDGWLTGVSVGASSDAIGGALLWCRLGSREETRVLDGKLLRMMQWGGGKGAIVDCIARDLREMLQALVPLPSVMAVASPPVAFRIRRRDPKWGRRRAA